MTYQVVTKIDMPHKLQSIQKISTSEGTLFSNLSSLAMNLHGPCISSDLIVRLTVNLPSLAAFQVERIKIHVLLHKIFPVPRNKKLNPFCSQIMYSPESNIPAACILKICHICLFFWPATIQGISFRGA